MEKTDVQFECFKLTFDELKHTHSNISPLEGQYPGLKAKVVGESRKLLPLVIHYLYTSTSQALNLDSLKLFSLTKLLMLGTVKTKKV